MLDFCCHKSINIYLLQINLSKVIEDCCFLETHSISEGIEYFVALSAFTNQSNSK